MKKRFITVIAAAIALSSSLTVFAAPETMPDGTVFDAEYYAQNNPDVVNVFGNERNSLYQHYVTYGKAEGRPASAGVIIMPDGTVFDAEYYAQNNPDVVRAFGNNQNLLYQHYVAYGKAEGRLASAGGVGVAPATNKQGITLPYFKIVHNDVEITKVRLKTQRDTTFFSLDSFTDVSAGINGKVFTINNLYLPDNYLGLLHEINSEDIPFGLVYDFREGILYSPDTEEDFTPVPIVFESDGGIILKY